MGSDTGGQLRLSTHACPDDDEGLVIAPTVTRAPATMRLFLNAVAAAFRAVIRFEVELWGSLMAALVGMLKGCSAI